MGTNSTGCTEWERDFDPVTEQPREIDMTFADDQRQGKINAYIDDWMVKLNARAKDYQKQGLPVEVAMDRATFDIRMEIRKSPPLKLD
ncbi:hypothetical protein KIP88_03025 [Bradyrhizobium sp. SRL28]|uniref:hypothetical protein n=1 Tax=Bradyrhizobium sp. SRL28 TaxID=2836178 RepID=UPI001BDEB504|nr:hypothetical protein [Bradyrhizobium sp. SRL28]MBT1509465.1 hypothetical protein [Bradyrhizobium sp. SRL28]